ncbi:MAG TPA: aspartate aminotransferase family protein [Candidatus Desulfaltia sp.]|nr:aspartate aminotransferase family protein [Candidatus Desulfaltia sp.]
MTRDKGPRELTLDPENWGDLRKLGHRMLDDMMNHLEQVRDRPIMQKVADEAREAFMQPPPMRGVGAEAAYEEFVEQLLRNQSNFNKHPRFWGFVVGTGSPSGMLADMLASGLNVNMVGGPLASTMLEMQVTAWMKGLLGFPMEAGGILVSGGSMANLLGLTVARNTMAEDTKQLGARRGMTVYGSEEMHVCVQKTVEMLGIGSDNLRKVPVDSEYRIDVQALEERIREDRAAGLEPFCVVGNAGTVNTGSFDDLEALADLCSREDLWLHVDGAFGAWAAIVPELRHLVRGLERADSVAFDLHKWMYMPYDVGCVLFKRQSDQVKTFSNRPDYFAMSKDTPQFADFGFELSRSFRALKVWMGLKENGVAKYSALVKQNVDQAGYLKTLIESRPELELMAPVPLNTVCFRYKGKGIPDPVLDELNKGLSMRLMFSGAGAASETRVKGRVALRVCFTNHRTTRRDLEEFVEAAAQMGVMMAQSPGLNP